MGIPKPKPVACLSCNTRKVRCSGGSPCKQCGNDRECVYPQRDRRIKVSQSYLDRLLRENEQLRAKTTPQRQSPTGSEDGTVASGGDCDGDDPTNQDAAKNPLLQEQPWFASLMSSDTPIWIGEASDAAFATRLAQLLTPSAQQDTAHLPRTSYVTDTQLHDFASRPEKWPAHGQALFLAQAALWLLNRSCHISRASQVLASLEHVAVAGDDGGRSVAACKLYAIFAVGELCTSRSRGGDGTFPGLGYFAKASKMLAVVQERPSLDVLETLLLLSLYSIQVNRRHAAYTLAGSAVRLGTVMGLHLGADASIQDPETREHRTRVWWTAYTFDRMWASKIGLPPSIPDEDVLVGLPASIETAHHDDFMDHEYLISSVRLARLSGNIISSIYRRSNADTAFSTRVHSTLRQLRSWEEELPPHLQLNADKGTPDAMGRVVSLHLSFNQCLITATRPILLSVLQSHLRASGILDGDSPRSEASGVALSISQACLDYARRSHSILINSWITGSFNVFDFFYTQYLFSSTTILGIATLLETDKLRSDMDGLEVGSDLLQELHKNGNFLAQEYHLHMDRLLSKIRSLCPSRDTQPTVQPEATAVANEQLFSASQPPFLNNIGYHTDGDPLQSFLDDSSLQWGLLDTLTYP